jgi:hypothetical protein
MNRSIEHQDAAGRAGAPLGIFLNDELLAVVPEKADPYGYATVERVAAQMGVEPRGFDVLTVCHIHPQVPAVDCTDCVPLDAD